MEKSENSYLGKAPIGKLMRGYALPCIISLLVGALYNIVDQIFIANASYLGSYGNAANTVVFPLTVIALAIAVMIGDGCCAFVSLSLGKQESDRARKSVGNSVVLMVVSGIMLMLIYLIFSNAIITMFGGTVNEETFRHSKEYFFYITLGIPFYMFGQAMNPVIRADGNPKFAMASTLAGAVINIILDPIFIFAFKWGMMGAAVATVIGQVVTAILAVWYLAGMKVIKPEKSDLALDGDIIRRTLILGITSFLSQISLVAAMAAINNMIRKYGAMDAIFGQEQYAQIPMAVVGIVMKFFQIVISIVVGMAAGCIPVVGYNMGAGLKDRVRKLFTILLAAEASVGAVALVIVELFPRALIGIFGAANESAYYTDFAIKAFRIYLCMMIFACVNKACFIFLQAMGKALESTVLSMVREIVFGVGFALLLPLKFGLDGVLYSMPLSDLLTFLIAVFLIVQTYKELHTSDMDVKEQAKVKSVGMQMTV
ncbi:MAG: MATE family efflux transporter [Lachnospiraceae bacterium]|nr:MATE family efflux transporter [Lachnospiraceae bacterium]